MAVVKCKMCGAVINAARGKTSCACDRCGTMQTLPCIYDELKADEFQRADDLRRSGDFDGAAKICENLISEGEKDPEVCWLLALCRFGVTYFQDPSTGKQIPSAARPMHGAFSEDVNVKKALESADVFQRFVYAEEAKVIDSAIAASGHAPSNEDAAEAESFDEAVRSGAGSVSAEEPSSDNIVSSESQNVVKNEEAPATVPVEQKKEEQREALLFKRAAECFNSAKTREDFLKAAEMFDRIKDFRNAGDLAKICRDEADKASRQASYEQALTLMRAESKERYEEAAVILAEISGWKDADEKLVICREKIAEAEAREEARRLEEEKRKAEKRERNRKNARKAGIAGGIAAAALALCAAAAALVIFVIVPGTRYGSAVDLYNSGNYEEAAEAFSALGGFRDSEDYLLKCRNALAQKQYEEALKLYDQGSYREALNILGDIYYFEGVPELTDKCCIGLVGEEAYAKVKGIGIGDEITFGRYEQDADTTNGPEDIQWIVLDRRGLSFLVISKYAVEMTSYHSENVAVTWKNCSLRQWLNNDFYNTAFNDDERAMIIPTENQEDPDSEFKTYGSDKTTDNVFLLSLEEAKRYLLGKEAMKCEPTKYVKDRGGYISGIETVNEGHCWWWLRSPGETEKLAAQVCFDGALDLVGRKVGYKFDVARPVIWISFE